MDDKLIESLHEIPLWHPAIEEEHDKDSFHIAQESINRADDETEEDLAINNPEDGDEASHPSESMSLEAEECLKHETPRLREGCAGERNLAPTSVPLILHEYVEVTTA